MIKWEKIRKNKKFVNKDKSIRIEVGKEGFCLWVKEDKVWHWVLDASKILETMELDISMDTLWTQDLLGRKERTGMSITDTRSEWLKEKDEGRWMHSPIGGGGGRTCFDPSQGLAL